MLKSIFECTYMPSLCVRPSEMRALEELPEKDKDVIFPYIMLSPWVGSSNLLASINRIEKSYGSRTFILGIDRYYPKEKTKSDAQRDFARISGGENHYRDYLDFAKSVEQAIPCAFLVGANYESLRHQIDAALKLDKGVVVSVDRYRSNVTEELGAVLEGLDADQFGVHICGGWSNNPLFDELWFTDCCKFIFSAVEKAPIVLSTTSFPKLFDHISGVEEVPIGSRELFKAVSQRFNNERLIYGDWGSAKPRSDETASPAKPRIDYALGDKWVIARRWKKNQENNWDYADAAANLMASAYWPREISVWGEMRIQQTAHGLAFPIDSAPSNVAARINIHLHQQANFGVTIKDTDDPWDDEF
ncbi:beta family protein [Rhizobium lemnae]